MKTKLLVVLGLMAVALIVLIAADLPISRFPNAPTPLESDLFVLAQTQAPATNKNIRYDQLRGAIRSGLATEAYVNTVSNILAANAGFARLEVQTNSTRLGLVTNLNWTYGVTGSVSGTTAILGVDDSLSISNLSNNISTTITVTSNFLATSSVQVATNTNSLVLQSFPIKGSQWYVGSNGNPQTFGSRAGLEFNTSTQSVRWGSLQNLGVLNHHYLATSNYWDAVNLGFNSYAYGSNELVNAADSTIGGGANNLIYTNAHSSVIAGGTNNSIRTNAYGSVIGGGGNNTINVNANNSVIGGGSDNDIAGGSANSVISGGFDNNVVTANAFSFMGGGRNNNIGSVAGTDLSQNGVVVGGELNFLRGKHGFIGGGSNNNIRATSGADVNVIVGGIGNEIGVAPTFPSTFCFIGGGLLNDIDDAADYSVIAGGRNNLINGSANTNCVISGGAFNTIGVNTKFATIPGGERHSVSGNYSFVIGGGSNSVTVARSGAIGMNVTNDVADTVVVQNLREYRSISTVAGTGTGSTNYTIQANSPRNYLGSSNVNIVAVMQTVPSRIHNWDIIITNLSSDTWGIGFSSATNRWKFQSWMYGTNAPVTLTNNTLLRLHGESEGTNTLVTYEYFRPAL